MAGKHNLNHVEIKTNQLHDAFPTKKFLLSEQNTRREIWDEKRKSTSTRAGKPRALLQIK